MTNYENFNPTIPEVEEPQVRAELPPVQDSDLMTGTPDKDKPKSRKKKGPTSKTRPAEKEKKSFSQSVKDWAGGQTVRWLLGLLWGFLGAYLGVSFASYLSACIADQSEILNAPLGEAVSIVNEGGEAGARLSEWLINRTFGVGSFVIVFWLVAMAFKLLTGRPRFKTVNFTIKCIVLLITLSLIVGQLTIDFKSPVNWGGYQGLYVNRFVNGFIGEMGSVLLCLFMLGVCAVICLRDGINWVIGLKNKHAEKRRAAAERKAEQQAREAELVRLRQLEEERALLAEQQAAIASQTPDVDDNATDDKEDKDGDGEGSDSHAVSFEDDETGFYSSLSDFEEPSMTRNEPEEIETEVQVADVPVAGDEYVLPEGDDEEDDGEVTDEPGGGNGDDAGDMVINVNTIAQAKANRPADGVLPGMHPYKFPPATLLREGVERISVDAEEQMENKEKIKKTLLDFGIPITSIEATVGPTVTLYEIVPDRGVKINRIRNLADDIALRIAAVGVRIIAPIPGKGTVGIEVANNDPQTVSMRTVILSHKYQDSKYKLPIALGSTISNEVFIADLAKMPHLLVAGATGQGKSVGLNAIIASLLYRKTPDELKFVMIDPKMVEFSLYAKIEAHYLAKIPESEDAIITDMDKVVATLSSLCVEMDDRYQLLKSAHTRNIEEYNEKIRQGALNPLEGHKFLPYIVVVVDEFSDLIMTAGKEVEIPIARLAQKARAVGMHVIIATQRPSTNVITGIIKANFPARIAFKVSSGVDSKTILDTPGAQQLIGRGDMLISNNAPMVRVQCAFIDTPEVEAICDYIERQPYGQGAYRLPEPAVNGSGSDSDSEMGNNFGDKDPLFDEVARLIVTSNTASTSSLQRRYSIGYNRAGKIMDQLEAAGIVGPSQGGKPRSVLVDSMTLETILNP